MAARIAVRSTATRGRGVQFPRVVRTNNSVQYEARAGRWGDLVAFKSFYYSVSGSGTIYAHHNMYILLYTPIMYTHTHTHRFLFGSSVMYFARTAMRSTCLASFLMYTRKGTMHVPGWLRISRATYLKEGGRACAVRSACARVDVRQCWCRTPGVRQCVCII